VQNQNILALHGYRDFRVGHFILTHHFDTVYLLAYLLSMHDFIY